MSLDRVRAVVRASKPEISDPNNRKLPKELKANCSAN